MASRSLTLGVVALALLLGRPAPAHADATAFWGITTTPATRSASGFSVGVNILVIGFEFEYSHLAEDAAHAAPGVGAGMINGLIQTPTPHAQFYVTAGGGFYHESLNASARTSFGTNVGGGVKLGLAGPLRLRIDYRVFSLHGSTVSTPKRLYAGLNLSF